MESGQQGSTTVAESNLEDQRATSFNKEHSSSMSHTPCGQSVWNVMAFTLNPVIFCFCSGHPEGWLGTHRLGSLQECLRVRDAKLSLSSNVTLLNIYIFSKVVE